MVCVYELPTEVQGAIYEYTGANEDVTTSKSVDIYEFEDYDIWEV